MSDYYVAGIDLGNTKIVGGVARKNSDGTTTLIAIEEIEPKTKMIENGSIKSVDETALAIKRMIVMLSNVTKKNINHCYITSQNITKDLGAGLITTIQNKLKKSVELEHTNLSSVTMIAHKYATPQEMEVGCISIDFGHTTTSYAYIENNNVVKEGVIPAGSHHITTDLMCLFDYKENIAVKLKHKLAKATMVAEKDMLVDLGGGRTIKVSELSEKIMERVVDIFKRALSYMGKNQWQSNRDRVIILAGGGSYLQNLDKYLSHRTGLQVRFAKCTDDTSELKTTVNIQNYNYAAILSLLNSATVNCEDPIKKNKGLTQKGIDIITSLFNYKEDDAEKFN